MIESVLSTEYKEESSEQTQSISTSNQSNNQSLSEEKSDNEKPKTTNLENGENISVCNSNTSEVSLSPVARSSQSEPFLASSQCHNEQTETKSHVTRLEIRLWFLILTRTVTKHL